MPPSGEAGGGPRARLAAAAIYLVALGLLFGPALAPGEQFLFRDSGRMHHPVKRLVAEALAHGRLPQWNPYDGLGAPLVADPTHAAQHPFNALLVALPFEVAFKAWVLASCLAACLGAFAWARALGARGAGPLLAGLAYGLSGFVVSSTDNLVYLASAAFVPWVLAAGQAYAARGDARRLLAVGAASFCCVAAGDPVAWLVAVALLPAVAALVATEDRVRAARRGALASGVALVAGAPVLLPLLAWLPASSRADPLSPVAHALWNLHPARLLELGLPDLTRDPTGDTGNEVLRVFAGSPPGYGPWVLSLYVGVSVLLLAGIGAARRTVRILLAGAAAFTWAAMGPHAGFAAVAERLPLLSALRFWEKLTVWPTLALAVAAGFGAADALERPGATRALFRASAAAALSLGLAAVGVRVLPVARALARTPDAAAGAEMLAANLADGTAHAAALAALLAAAALLVRRGGVARVAPAIVLLVVGGDLVSANVRAYRLAAVPPAREASALGRRLAREPGLPAIVTPFALRPVDGPGLSPFEGKWRRGALELYPEWNAGAHVRNSFPYAGMPPRRYATFDEAVPLERRVAALGGLGFAFVVVPRGPELLRGTALAPPWTVEAAEPGLDTVLVAVPHRPRAYLASEARSTTAAEALAVAADPALAARRSVAVEAEVAEPVSAGDAAIVRDEPELVVVRTSASGPALLVLNDAFAPGWTAEVDGRSVPIHPANYAARGVFVGPGAHEVRFVYRTPLLAAGWAVAGAGLAALLAALALARRRARAPARAL